MKTFIWVFAILLFAVPTRAQDCDNVVADYSGSLKSGDAQRIEEAARPLVNEGADLRVRILGTTSNLDTDEKDIERSCLSWQSPNHGRKSTLVVLMVAPFSHKMGIYYGNAFDHALADHWNRIKTDYMGPHFKTGDWAGGFVAVEQQITSRIKAAKDEAVHPATTTTTTVNQAADLSGLWIVLKWSLFLAFLLVGIYFTFAWWNKRRKAQQELREAQQLAITTKARAADLLNKPNSVKTATLDRALEEFARLNGSMRNDPNPDDLTIEEYHVIALQYQKIVDMLDETSIARMNRPVRQSVAPSPKKQTKAAAAATTGSPGAPSTSTTTVINNTEVIPVPVIIPEPVRERERDPEPEPSPSHRSSRSSDDDSGGGSSSWSSGSSDSGGSSDFGGSSDSGGGGGSSDF